MSESASPGCDRVGTIKRNAVRSRSIEIEPGISTILESLTFLTPKKVTSEMEYLMLIPNW